MTKIRPSSFRSFHLNASNVTINPIIISTNNVKEQTPPVEETAILELLTMHHNNHGKGFLKIIFFTNDKKTQSDLSDIKHIEIITCGSYIIVY